MISWPVLFLVLATIAAYLGFFGLSGTVAVAGQMLFLVLLVLLAASTLMGLMQDEPPL